MGSLLRLGIHSTTVFLLWFAIANPVHAQDFRQRLITNHRLYLPEGAGPFPAIVAVPGCSGVSLEGPATDRGGGSPTDPLFRRHYPRMAERLRGRGYAVILVDYLSAEHVVNACSGEISAGRIADYIGAAVAWVREQPRIDPSRVHIVAWSLGGAGLFNELERLPDTVPFVSAVALYPACAAARPWRASVPLLLLLGDADDITPPGHCDNLLQQVHYRDLVVVRHYPNARHGFDVDDAPAVVTTGRGTTVGYNRDAAVAAWDEIFQFLGKR